MIGPFTVEAVLVVLNMGAMWLSAPCLVRPTYPYPRWLQRWGVVVFTLAFAMLIVNLNMWMDITQSSFAQELQRRLRQ